MYFLKLGDTAIVGSSPEMLVKVQGRDAFYRPIAGTRPRGRDEQGGSSASPPSSPPIPRSAPNTSCWSIWAATTSAASREYGSVRVERLEFVERYSHVMHLVSSLRGRLRPDVDCFDALAACFPGGTVSGAPKVRAMEIIDELEPTRRGIYAGAILYLDFSGNLDSCIAIRTMVVKKGVGLRAGRRGSCRRFGARARVSGDGQQGARSDRRAGSGASRSGPWRRISSCGSVALASPRSCAGRRRGRAK